MWCGGSLRPWQVLHFKLAQLQDHVSSELDVWELIDETVEAACSHRKLKEQHDSTDDDEEFWRHGGLMEVKIRDWLASKMVENDERNRAYFDTMAIYTNSDDYDNGIFNYCIWDHSTAQEHRSCLGLVYEEQYEEDDQYTDGHEDINYMANLMPPLNMEACYSNSYSIGDKLVEPADIMRGDDERDEVCAVCLEKLFDWPASGGRVTRLQCHHSFHSLCLSPWLDSSPCCPCCRAPTTGDQVLAGPPDVEVMSSVDGDMMGLLVEIEAALGRIGFLS